MKGFLIISLERLKKIKKHFNQNRQTLDRGLNLRSRSAKQASHPLQGDDRWLRNVSQNVFPLFWITCIPLLSSQALFISTVSYDVSLSFGHLCQSDIMVVSSNGGWSDARKSFFAGCVTYLSARTAMCSLSILVTSIFASEFLNTAY